MYVISSSRLICTYSRRNELGNCWPTTTVLKSMASATSICGLGTDPDEILTYGILPDGVSEVVVIREDGPDSAIPVRRNVYAAPSSSAPPLPVWVSFVQDGRRVLRPTGVPPDVARKGCTRAPPTLR